MKLNNHKFVICLLLLLSNILSTYAFDVPVHAKITEVAVNGCTGFWNYLQDNNFDPQKQYYGAFPAFPSSGLTNLWITASNLIRNGSMWEDGANIDSGGDRPLNHFYDPTTKQGLSLSGVSLGLPSKTWATTSNAVNPALIGGGFNEYAWQNARGYQSNSIAQNSSTIRDKQVALMFRSVGQVVHLLQDAAQPQHARNEQHLDQYPWTSINTPWRSAFEDWGRKHIDLITFTPQDLDWVDAGFTCVSNFWDRGLFYGQSTSPLVANETTGPTLGLAEYCNGNFLTVRGTYGDLLGKLGYNFNLTYGMSQDYYPTTQSTDLAQVETNPAAYATSTYLLYEIPPQTVYRCYIDKTSQGAVVSPIPRWTLSQRFSRVRRMGKYNTSMRMIPTSCQTITPFSFRKPSPTAPVLLTIIFGDGWKSQTAPCRTRRAISPR